MAHTWAELKKEMRENGKPCDECAAVIRAGQDRLDELRVDSCKIWNEIMDEVTRKDKWC
jgi:hypothetical protein